MRDEKRSGLLKAKDGCLRRGIRETSDSEGMETTIVISEEDIRERIVSTVQMLLEKSIDWSTSGFCSVPHGG